MDYAMQQEVWDRLPLNEYQRNDMLHSLLTEVQTSQDEMDTLPAETPQHPKSAKGKLPNNPKPRSIGVEDLIATLD
jgi:hypothetical protein